LLKKDIDFAGQRDYYRLYRIIRNEEQTPNFYWEKMMAARKRDYTTETLAQYHRNLRKEAKKLKHKLAGKVLWSG
jgi:hypothetical protein